MERTLAWTAARSWRTTSAHCPPSTAPFEAPRPSSAVATDSASARVKILGSTALACPEPGSFRPCHATDASTVATDDQPPHRALETS